MDFSAIVEAQRRFFNSGATRDNVFRIEALMKLKEAIIAREQDLTEAMSKDMNKCRSEVYLTEIGIVLDEIRYHMGHLNRWTRTKHVYTPARLFPGSSKIVPEPYGVALIMAPWNYPINLTLNPLIGAISAGCTAVVKPSAYAPNTSAVIADMLGSIFKPEYIKVVEGGRDVNSELLEQKYDYIFFTGSKNVGKLVMERAAAKLTPVTLELGGKSPVIVDKTANMAIAARRIAFGKTLNGGQTCVEPDYVFVHKDVKDEFIRNYEEALARFFPKVGASPEERFADMNVIINDKHFERVKRLMNTGNTVIGGYTDAKRRFIEPTVIDGVSPDAPIMREEIFAPVLPVMEFSQLNECIEYIRSNERPLALYIFTNDKSVVDELINSCSFGGCCINDTMMHLASANLPFGGVGESGMGCYHGRKSFDTFTHYRSILKRGIAPDIPLRYRPYTSFKNKLIKKFLR